MKGIWNNNLSWLIKEEKSIEKQRCIVNHVAVILQYFLNIVLFAINNSMENNYCHIC